MTETLPDIPHLKWKYRVNEETGETEFDTFCLSDGGDMDQQRFLEALKNLTGSTDLEVGHSIIRDTANILSAESIEEKLNKASAMLSALHPKDETEAMLLGQFLALRDSGMGCLKRAQNQDMINHFEKLLILATKILLEKNGLFLDLMERVLERKTCHVQSQQPVVIDLMVAKFFPIISKNR